MKKNGTSISVSCPWHLFAQGTAQLGRSPREECQKCNAERWNKNGEAGRRAVSLNVLVLRPAPHSRCDCSVVRANEKCKHPERQIKEVTILPKDSSLNPVAAILIPQFPEASALRAGNGSITQIEWWWGAYAWSHVSVRVTLDVPGTARDKGQHIRNANIDFLLTEHHSLSRIINNLVKLSLERGETQRQNVIYSFPSLPLNKICFPLWFPCSSSAFCKQSTLILLLNLGVTF